MRAPQVALPFKRIKDLETGSVQQNQIAYKARMGWAIDLFPSTTPPQVSLPPSSCRREHSADHNDLYIVIHSTKEIYLGIELSDDRMCYRFDCLNHGL